MDSDWIEYMCKSGKTVFLYNKETGEHKWPPGCDNGPPEDSIMYGRPVEYKVLISIATQTDDYGCNNGCTSMYINTDKHHTTNFTELPYSQLGITVSNVHDVNVEHCTEKVEERNEQCQDMNVLIYNRTCLTDDREEHSKDQIPSKGGQRSTEMVVKLVQNIKQECISECQEGQNHDKEMLVTGSGCSQSVFREDGSKDEIFTIPSMLEKEEFFPGYNTVQKNPIMYYADNENLQLTQLNHQHGSSKPHADSVDSSQKHKNGNNFQNDKEILKCSYCLKPFKCKSALTVHIRMHTGESPFECPYCDKKCKQQSDLNKHLRIHTKEKPFACSYCGKAFGRKDHLNEHTTTHTGVKQFECFFCKKRFAQKCNLNGHLKLHSGVKPFECTVCGKAFAEKGNLKKHYMTHTGEKPFECSVCSRKFARRQDMEAHLTIHTGLKPFECPHCQLQFRQKKALNKHMAVHMTEPVAVAINVNCISVNIEETNVLQSEKSVKHSKVEGESYVERPYEIRPVYNVKVPDLGQPEVNIKDSSRINQNDSGDETSQA